MLGFDRIEAKMAWRNLLANRRRSLLTVSVIGIGVLSLLFLSGYINFIKIGFGGLLRQTSYGDFQIYPQGFRALHDESSDRLLFDKDEQQQIKDVLYNALEEDILFINPRIYLSGQISNGQQTAIFIGYGGDVYGETQMKNVQVLQGSLLRADTPNAIVLGKGLAAALEVELGQQLILQVPQQGGFPLAELGQVVGIVDYGFTQLNNRQIITDLRLAQLLRNGAGAQRLIVHFDSKRRWDTLYRTALQALEQAKAKLPPLEQASWLELAEFYNRVIRLYNNQLYVFAAIFLLMFFFSISNSLYMSIMERQAEIGTLRAIGISRREVVRVIFLEGFLLGIGGFVLGLLLAGLIQLGLEKIQIMQPPPPGLSDSVRLMILLSLPSIALFGLLSVGVASFATLLPSSKAVRKNIVDAIRTI